MTGGSLPLVFVIGERAVCHAVDPSARAGDILAQLPLYLAAIAVPSGELVWSSPSGPRALDPTIPIGDQVPADAWIESAGVPPGLPGVFG